MAQELTENLKMQLDAAYDRIRRLTGHKDLNRAWTTGEALKEEVRQEGVNALSVRALEGELNASAFVTPMATIDYLEAKYNLTLPLTRAKTKLADEAGEKTPSEEAAEGLDEESGVTGGER